MKTILKAMLLSLPVLVLAGQGSKELQTGTNVLSGYLGMVGASYTSIVQKNCLFDVMYKKVGYKRVVSPAKNHIVFPLAASAACMLYSDAMKDKSTGVSIAASGLACAAAGYTVAPSIVLTQYLNKNSKVMIQDATRLVKRNKVGIAVAAGAAIGSMATSAYNKYFASK